MKFLGLVLKSARRSKRRTALTMISVALAVFLFSALRAVLDGFDAVSAGQLLDAPRHHPLDVDDLQHADSRTPRRSRARRACRTSPGRTGSAASTRIRRISSAQFAVEPESYLRMYPEIILTPEERQAFLDDRTGCIVGDGLAKKYGFKVGDKLTLQVGIPVYGSQRLRLHHPRHLQGRRRRGRQPVDDVPLEVRRRAIDAEGADRLGA